MKPMVKIALIAPRKLRKVKNKIKEQHDQRRGGGYPCFFA